MFSRCPIVRMAARRSITDQSVSRSLRSLNWKAFKVENSVLVRPLLARSGSFDRETKPGRLTLVIALLVFRLLLPAGGRCFRGSWTAARRRAAVCSSVVGSRSSLRGSRSVAGEQSVNRGLHDGTRRQKRVAHHAHGGCLHGQPAWRRHSDRRKTRPTGTEKKIIINK